MMPVKFFLWVLLYSLIAINKGLASDRVFLPAWDSVCGFGKEIEDGCAKIRSREIVDASQKPWSAIGQVNYSGNKNRQHCTGTLISKRHFLTSAHCLYNRSKKKWISAEQIHFVAGYQRGEYVRHSTAKGYVVSKAYNTKSNEFQYIPAEDWAVVELKDDIGVDTGYIQLGSTVDLDAKDEVVIAGYPGVRRFVQSSDNRCGELEDDRRLKIYIHHCRTMAGDSGGPVLRVRAGKFEIVAITSGVAVVDGKALSFATPVENIDKRITIAE